MVIRRQVPVRTASWNRSWIDLELAVAADERQFQPRPGARPRDDTDDPGCRHGLGLALEGQWRERLEHGGLADQAAREAADHDLAGSGGLLEAGRHVDRVARHEALTEARVAGDHRPGVDADPQAELDPELRGERRCDALEGRLHVERGADRAQGVVLAALRQAEDGHDRVPDVLLDDPAVVLEDAAQLLEGPDGR